MKIDEGDLPEELKKNVFLTTIDNVYNWGRVCWMWPMAFRPGLLRHRVHGDDGLAL